MRTSIAAPPPAARVFHSFAGFVEDGVLLLLVVISIPVIMLLIGTPIALFLPPWSRSPVGSDRP